MEFKYWNIYKTFFWDVVTSQSFPLFVLYIILTSVCYKWKKVCGPLSFPKVLFVYNIAISLVNVICFLGFVNCLWRSDSLYDKKPDPLLKQVYFVYWMTKIVELSDTLFMILKHKFRQVSPLHVYHHATMLILSEMGYRKYAWASFAMPLTLNALVHVVLYLYYGLTAVGIQPGWKKKLTEMQIIQFLIDLVHGFVGFAKHNFCSWAILYAVSMIYLFGSFYYRTYVASPKDTKKRI